jgi:ATPase subunit of ABC transporter with duplicated ATPase domains
VADRLGNEVIEFVNVSKSFGDRLLIDNLSFKVPAGAIVGIIGPNGAGKSTLFRMIAGKEKPDSGEVKIGSTVKMAFVDQNRDDLSNEKPSGKTSPAGWTSSTSASSRWPAAPIAAASISTAPTSKNAWACCLVASAGACTWPRP